MRSRRCAAGANAPRTLDDATAKCSHDK
jgi:hypothetical protein